MQIVVATQALAGLGGSESYAVTVADQLQRLGHDIWLHAVDHGAAAAHASALGLRVTGAVSDLPDAPDVIVSQDGVVAYELAASHPRTPQVFVAHSDVFDLQLPPALPGIVSVVVTLYDRVEQRVRACSSPYEVVRLGQPVDVDRFKPTTALRARPAVALALGNYVHGERLEILRRACGRAGVELVHVGTHGGAETSRPQDLLNAADIVFGKARVIYEAMACGRAAYVFDHNGAEGWVTDANRAALSADNFGGQLDPVSIGEDHLVADLARYDPASGLANRDFIVAGHAATKHTAALVGILRRVAGTGDPVPAEGNVLRELARLTRVAHRADAAAFALHAQLERATAEALRTADAVAGEQAGHAEVAAQAAAHAAALRDELDALTATRRWRATQWLLGPLDRVRRHHHRTQARDEPQLQRPAS